MRKSRGGWHKEDIKAEIRKRGTTLRQLALDNGLSESAIRSALCRPVTSAELVIASFLGIEPSLLWPERYTGKERRVRRSRLALQHKADLDLRHRQTEEVA